MAIELDPVDRLVADALGPPGARVFFLQARATDRLLTMLVEKEQVELLAASVMSLLAQMGKEVEGGSEPELALEDPIEPEWRAGRISVGYQEARDRFFVEVEEEVQDTPDPDREGETVRMWATAEQMLAMALHGAAVVRRGRPRCGLCGNPLDPEGHVCPALNGHGGG
ncbi:MAG TPA: DUF3090 domain-containing protein [Actinomycetota bacterium]